MKIESILKRKGGTKVTIERENYHFKPTETEPRHLAEVNIQSHIAQLLRIPEGYRVPEGEVLDDSFMDEVKDALKLNGSNIHAAKYQIGDREISLEELVLMAFEDSGISRLDWNELEDEDRYEYINRTLEELEREAATVPHVREEKEPIFIPEKDPAVDNEADELVVIEEPPVAKAPEAEPAKVADDVTPPTETISEAPPATNGQAEFEQLREQYKAKMGRYPSKLLSAERIKALLVAEED